MYPLSWAELREHFGYLTAFKQLEQRVVYGMYPDVINHQEDAYEVLKNLVNSYLFKDILGFGGIRKPEILEKLIQDGRIQPAKIEEKIMEAQTEIRERIKKAGEDALYEVGILDLPQELVYLLGRLNFRTSYGQNALTHSIEVSLLSAALASELGADIELSKKAGLLHDIGKAVDQEIERTHLELGRRILAKYNLPEEIIKAMQSHHDTYPVETIEAAIVNAADAISASRPGARKDSVEAYLKRLANLEEIASSYEGVEKVYAVSAGREIRVFVRPNKIDDLGAIKLAKNIAKRLEETLKYPGEVKVTVIRETRAIEIAR